MDKMLFQFTRIGFCDDTHTKQRRAIFLYAISVCFCYQLIFSTNIKFLVLGLFSKNI